MVTQMVDLEVGTEPPIDNEVCAQDREGTNLQPEDLLEDLYAADCLNESKLLLDLGMPESFVRNFTGCRLCDVWSRLKCGDSMLQYVALAVPLDNVDEQRRLVLACCALIERAMSVFENDETGPRKLLFEINVGCSKLGAGMPHERLEAKASDLLAIRQPGPRGEAKHCVVGAINDLIHTMMGHLDPDEGALRVMAKVNRARKLIPGSIPTSNRQTDLACLLYLNEATAGIIRRFYPLPPTIPGLD